MPVNGYYRFCTNQAQNAKEMEAENNQNRTKNKIVKNIKAN